MDGLDLSVIEPDFMALSFNRSVRGSGGCRKHGLISAANMRPRDWFTFMGDDMGPSKPEGGRI